MAASHNTSTEVHVDFMADHPDLIESVIDMQWAEWGQGQPAVEHDRWVRLMRTDTNRDRVPTAFVAVTHDGKAAGIVQLHEFDIESRRDRSPWICGMFVRSDLRGRGVGEQLLQRVQRFAKEHGIRRLWVFTDTAPRFYERCEFKSIEQLDGGTLLEWSTNARGNRLRDNRSKRPETTTAAEFNNKRLVAIYETVNSYEPGTQPD